MSRLSPGFKVLLYLPSRSTITSVCWRTILTDLTSGTTTTANTITARTISKISTALFLPHQGGGALELDHPDAVADGERLGAVKRPRPPQLALDLDHAAVLGDGLQHQRGLALHRPHAHGHVLLAAGEVPAQC